MPFVSRISPISTSSLGFTNADNPKSKIPLRQIVQFVERLQKQNTELQTQLDVKTVQNNALSETAKRIDFLELENKRLHNQADDHAFIVEQYQIITREKDAFLKQIDDLNNQINFLPVLQEELKIAEEQSSFLRRDLLEAKQTIQDYSERIRVLEDIKNASEVRLDVQMREISDLSRENRALTNLTLDLKSKFKYMLVSKGSLDKQNASERSELETALREQVQKLKMEKRNLFTEKLKLESELVLVSDSQSDDCDADVLEKINSIELELQKTLEKYTTALATIDLKDREIAQLHQNNEFLLKTNDCTEEQFMKQKIAVEIAKKSLSLLHEKVDKDLISFSKTDAADIVSRQFVTESSSQTDYIKESKNEERSSELNRINELETEVKGLSLYVSKIVSRVMNNEILENAICNFPKSAISEKINIEGSVSNSITWNKEM